MPPASDGPTVTLLMPPKETPEGTPWERTPTSLRVFFAIALLLFIVSVGVIILAADPWWSFS
jgi:hypothetical protein